MFYKISPKKANECEDKYVKGIYTILDMLVVLGVTELTFRFYSDFKYIHQRDKGYRNRADTQIEPQLVPATVRAKYGTQDKN